MRPCVLILIAMLFTAFAQADETREKAYDRLRDEARANHLVAEVASEIKAHRYEAALKKAEEAIALQPKDAVALNARGAALTELRRYAEAEQDLKAASAADPKAFAPQFNQGEILTLQKKYSEAAAHFTMMQSRFGPLPILKYKLYLCYALDGQKEQARAALERMRYPQDGAAWYYAYAVDRLLADKRGEAQKLVNVAEAIHRDDIQTYRDTLRETGLLK